MEINPFFLIITIIFLSAIVTTMLNIGFNVIDMCLYKHYERKTSCEGIEQFFTNTSFLRDFYRMERYYFTFDWENNETNILLKPLPPSDMGEREYDCEDFSHAVDCLSNLYGVDCQFYSVHEVSEDYNMNGHIGNRCYVNDGWVVLH